MKFEEFQDSIDIQYIDIVKQYGHYHQLIAIEKGTPHSHNIAHLRINEIAALFKDVIKDGASEVFISLHLPMNDEINNEYVLLVHMQKALVDTSIIEFNVLNGTVIKRYSNNELRCVKAICSYFKNIY